MKFKILTGVTAVTILAVLALPTQCLGQKPNHKLPHYTVVDLATLGGTSSLAGGLSNSGWVSGQSTLADGNYRPALRRNDVITDLSLAQSAVLAHGQSPDSSRLRSTAGSTFVVAPAIPLAAAPTSAAAGDLNGDGKLDLVVTTQGSDSVTVLLGDGHGGFTAGVPYHAGSRPGSVLLADLTGSGTLDIAVIDGAASAVVVLRGKGDGTFSSPELYHAIADPVAIAVGNFGGKGKMDLAVASVTGLAVLLNDGAGNFSAVSSVSLAHPLRALAAADLAGEGHDDLIAANGDGTITVLKGQGDGHFQSLAAPKVASGPLSAVFASDFNRDGRPDLAVTEAGSNRLTVLLSHGDGTFEPGVQYIVGNSPAFVTAADLRGKGVLDLITANAGANTFSVLAGNGDGTFRPTVDFTAGNSPIAAVAGDFYGKGHADIAVLNAGDSTISLPQGHGDGTFHAAPSYRTGLGHKSIAAGDLRGTGQLDLVVANSCGDDSDCESGGTVSVLIGKKDGTHKQGSTYAVGSGPVAVALANVNSDKKLALIALNRDEKTLSVLPGKDDGEFGEPQVYDLAASPRAVYVGDFNGDGRADLAVSTDCGHSFCSEPGSVEIWLGHADGKFSLSASYTVGFSPVSIAAGDLRGTGHLDLVVANSCGDDSSCKSHGTASLLKGDDKGKFADGGEIDLGNAPSSIALASLTGKGLDLVVAERGSNRIAVLHSDGKGSFGDPVTYKAGSEPAALAIADFDGDGRLDVAVANFKDSTVSVLAGNAEGTLNAAVNYPVGTGPEALAVIAGAKGAPPSLVTADGNDGAKPIGADITALLQVQADVQAPTTTTLTELPATPAIVDQEITLTAVVAGDLSNPPTGSVTFSTTDSSTITGTLTCVGPNDNTLTVGSTSSSATCNVFLVEGAYFFEASYTGDANNASSNSVTPSAEYDVNTAPTTTTVTAPASQSDTASLVVTATVAPTTKPANPANVQTIGGSGSFSIDGSSFAPCSSQGMTFNSATGTASAHCTIPSGTLTDGPHFLSTAFSSSDANYSNSSGFTFITVGGTSQTAIGFSASPTVDQAVTITATVAKLSGGSGSPTGTVTFSGTVPGCGSPAEVLVPVNGSGQAVCSPPISTLFATPSGTPYSVTATYNPDAASTYLTSNSGAQALAVAKATPLSQTPPPITATFGVPFTITAAVAPPSGTSTATDVPMGGSFTFMNGATAIAGCSGPIPVNYDYTTGLATATCSPTPSSLTAGTYTITAAYSGDTDYAAGTPSQFLLTINPQTADLAITKTGPTVPVPAGTSFTYNIGVSNAGPSDAPNVVVSDTLPPGVTFVGSTGGCTGTTLLTCNLGTLVNGASTSFSVTVHVPANYLSSRSETSATLSNTAKVASSATDPNLSNNTSTALTAVIAVADLSITKSGLPNPVDAGTPLTYTITVNNAGPSDSTGTSVSDVLPAGVNFTTSSTVCTGTTTLTCPLGTLAAGGTTTFTATVGIPANYLSSRFKKTATITNTATVAPGTGVTDPNLSNNTASVSTTVIQVADVEIAVSEAPNPVHQGGTATYKISFTNTGPSDAPFAQILQYFPAGFVFAGSTYGTCGAGANDVVCSLGPDMPVGYKQTFTISYKIPAKFLGAATSKIVTSQTGISSQAIDPDPADSTIIINTTVIK